MEENNITFDVSGNEITEPVSSAEDVSESDISAEDITVPSETESSPEPDIFEKIDRIYESVETEPEHVSVTVPIEGYSEWSYGITVTFKVYPYGFGSYMEQSEYCSEPSDFEAWYGHVTSCVGDTLRDFSILSITDGDGNEVYNIETENGNENPETPETPSVDYTLTLESLLTEIQSIKETENSYYQLVYENTEKSVELLTSVSACGIIIGFVLSAVFGGMVMGSLMSKLK